MSSSPRQVPRPNRRKAIRPSPDAMRDCGVYVDGHRLEGTFDHRSALEEVRNRGEGFVWLSLSRPDEVQMDAIAEVLEIPREEYGKYFFMPRNLVPKTEGKA